MITKSIVYTTLFGVMSVLCGSAIAGIETFKKSGGWEAWGGISEDGKKVCGIDTEGQDQWIGVKYFEGNDSMTIQLSKDTWSAKKGDSVNVSMQFDKESPWTADATAYKMSSGKVGLEISIPQSKLETWFTEFAGSKKLTIQFPDSNVDGWEVKLSGTLAISEAMTKCIGLMNK